MTETRKWRLVYSHQRVLIQGKKILDAGERSVNSSICKSYLHIIGYGYLLLLYLYSVIIVCIY